MAHEVHQVGAVFPVVDREVRGEADHRREFAQQPGPDGVERAGPGERFGDDRALAAECLGEDALDPARHLRRRAAREGQEQDAGRIGAVDDEMGDPVRERVRLARSRAGDDEKRCRRRLRPDPVLDGLTLLRIELGEIGGHESFPRDTGRDSFIPVLFASAQALA